MKFTIDSLIGARVEDHGVEFLLDSIILQDEGWFENHAGHLQLKEQLTDVQARRARWVLFRGLFSDEQLINVVAAFCKSCGHIQYITGHGGFSFCMTPWAVFKAEGRSMDAFKNRLNPLVEVLENNESHERCLAFMVFGPNTQKLVACAVMRRLVNLMEWASTMEVKLTSPTLFKWKTFDSITTSRVYVKE